MVRVVPIREGEVMAIGTVSAFWVVSILLALMPGADWAYAIAAGLRDRTVVPAIGGLVTGYVALTAVVAAGVAAVVARTDGLLATLTVLGAVYLIWLGLNTVTRPATPAAAAGAAPQSWLLRAVKGAGISGMNPKALLLFIALLPQFTNPSSELPVAVQIIVLGLMHTLSCAVVYTGVGTGARQVLAARPAAAQIVVRVSGFVMLGIGAVLLIEQVMA